MAAPSMMTVSTAVFLGFLVVCQCFVANGERIQGEGGLVKSSAFPEEMAHQDVAVPSRKMLARRSMGVPSPPKWAIAAVTGGSPVVSSNCATCVPAYECWTKAWCQAG